MKKHVEDISGHCSGGALTGHQTCWGEWETPSAVVRCRCECHVKKVVVPKTRGSKVLVKKSR